MAIHNNSQLKVSWIYEPSVCVSWFLHFLSFSFFHFMFFIFSIFWFLVFRFCYCALCSMCHVQSVMFSCLFFLEVEVSEIQSHSVFLVSSPMISICSSYIASFSSITLITNLDLHASRPSGEGVKVQAILAVCHSSGGFWCSSFFAIIFS